MNNLTKAYINAMLYFYAIMVLAFAADLEFEQAAKLRDEIKKLEEIEMGVM